MKTAQICADQCRPKCGDHAPPMMASAGGIHPSSSFCPCLSVKAGSNVAGGADGSDTGGADNEDGDSSLGLPAADGVERFGAGLSSTVHMPNALSGRVPWPAAPPAVDFGVTGCESRGVAGQESRGVGGCESRKHALFSTTLDSEPMRLASRLERGAGSVDKNGRSHENSEPAGLDDLWIGVISGVAEPLAKAAEAGNERDASGDGTGAERNRGCGA